MSAERGPHIVVPPVVASWFGLALAMAVVGCTSTRAAPAEAPASTAVAASPAPSSKAGLQQNSPEKSAQEAAAAAVDVALAQVSQARELPALGKVRGVALTRAEMAARVKETIEDEVPPEVVAAEAEFLIGLGLAPSDFDYAAAIVALMSSQLAGFYEPATKTMYLDVTLGTAEREATLAHELVHALQDQHYHLEDLMRYRPDQSDVQGAAHALAEGDATSAMFDQMLAPRGMKATDLSEQLIGVQVRAAASFTAVSGQVPDILKRSLVSPYTDGIEFVHFLRRKGGWAAVDGAWKSPPVSTEQLLHPEKFLAKEIPVVVAVPPPPEQDAGAPVYTDVMGEQSIRLTLEEWLPRAPAVLASTGWGGDRVGVWRYRDRHAIAWHIVSDDVAAATRTELALLRGVAAQREPSPAGKSEPCAERADRGPLLVSRKGRDLVVVAGPYVRQSGTSKSASTCGAARAWAQRILSVPGR